MLAKSGEVLYVGKATSLKSRVNSYFRGQTGRDRRKLEMLAQVWDLEVTPCSTAIEAALLECDEIKRHDPPYNVVMKRGRRHLVYYSPDLCSVSRIQDEEHRIGPFRAQNWLERLRMLERSLKAKSFEQIFYVPIDQSILEAGFELFCTKQGLTRDHPLSIRELMSLALRLSRREAPEDDSEEVEDQGSADPLEFTAQQVSEKFERLFRRAGAEYQRGHKLTELLDAKIHFQHNGETRALIFRHGQISTSDISQTPDFVQLQFPWRDLDIDTFDRMSVLMSELAKYEHQVTRLGRKRW